jgi:hypothetical protein
MVDLDEQVFTVAPFLDLTRTQGGGLVNYEKLAGNTQSTRRNPADHLKPWRWQPGQSGNPEGRPPKSLYQQGLEKLLNDAELVPDLLEAARKRMLTNTMVGALELRYSQERVDGPIKQELAISGELSISLAEAIAKRRQGGSE